MGTLSPLPAWWPIGREPTLLCPQEPPQGQSVPTPPALQQGRGAHRVHLAQNSTLSKEEWLAGVHHNQVEVGPPGPPWDISLWTGTGSAGGC